MPVLCPGMLTHGSDQRQPDGRQPAGVSAQLFNGLGVFYNHPSHRIKGSDQGT
jgi:hypothetical protein